MSRTKKISLILFIFVAIVGSGYLYTKKIVDNARVELNTFIEPMYRNLVENNWSIKSFNNYLCESEKDELKINHEIVKEIDELRSAISKYGRLKSYRGIVDFKIRKYIESEYAHAFVEIDFDNKNIYFNTIILKKNNKWCLYEFTFNK